VKGWKAAPIFAEYFLSSSLVPVLSPNEIEAKLKNKT